MRAAPTGYETWNGVAWSGYTDYDPGFYSGVSNFSLSCPTASFCAATSEESAITWNGLSWSSTATEVDSQYYAALEVSCPSASWCMAAGADGNYSIGAAAQPVPTVTVTDNSRALLAGGALTFTATVTGSGPAPTGTVTWALTGPGSPACADSELSAEGEATCTLSDAQAGAYTAIADYLGDANYGPALGTDDTTVASVATGGFGMPVELPFSDGGAFTGVNCTAATDCTAVGGGDEQPIFAVDAGGIWGTPVGFSSLAGPTVFEGVSCTATTDCTAVGWDGYDENDYQPTYAVESDGVWGPVTVSSSPDGGGQFYSVSCTAATDCTAVGIDADIQAVYAVEADGVWGPLTELSSPGGGGYFYGVSCTSAADCTAVGTNDDGQPMYAVESAGVWGPVTLSSSNDGQFNGVSCTSAADCTAIGYDNDDSGGGQPMYATESDGVWGPVTEFSYPDSAQFSSVSCTAAADCTAVGDGGGQPMYAVESDGVWGPVTVLSSPGGGGSFDGVSCAAVTNCTAVGSDGNGQPMYATESGTLAGTPTVTVTDDSPGVAVGGDFTYTATVTGSGATPTGTVTWTLTGPGSPTCAASKLSSEGIATCTVSDAQAGTYTATADYSGDSNYGPASGSDDTADVAKDATTTTLTLSKAKVTYGDEQVEKLSVTVTPGSTGSTPAGTVKVTDSATTLCTIALSGGKGSCSLKAAQLPAGTDSLEAVYSGSPAFGTSSSAQVIFIVAKATTKTTLKLSKAKVTYGDEQVEKLSVTVTPKYKNSTPAGSVRITDARATLCTITLSGGKGSCSLKARKLPAGTYSLVATYAPNPTNFEGSASKAAALTVAK